MEINKETYQLFQHYLEGKLSIEKEQDFKQKLSSDESFNQSFQEFELERSLVIANELAESKNILEGFSYEPPKSSSWNKLYYWLVGLGSLVIGLILFNFLIDKPVSHNDKLGVQQQIIVEKSHDKITKNNINEDVNLVDIEESIEKTKQQNPVENRVIVDTNSVFIVPQTIDSIKTKQPLLANNKTVQNQVVDKKEKVHNISNSKSINCETKKWDIEIKIEASCIEQENGKLQVVTSQPMTIIFNQEEKTANFIFEELEEGDYELFCVDSNGCEYEKEVTVISKICVEKDLIIDVSTNTFWEIPLDSKLIVRNSAGRLVFNTQVNKGDEYEGVDEYGVSLKSGVYFFELQAKEIYRGTITIP